MVEALSYRKRREPVFSLLVRVQGKLIALNNQYPNREILTRHVIDIARTFETIAITPIVLSILPRFVGVVIPDCFEIDTLCPGPACRMCKPLP